MNQPKAKQPVSAIQAGPQHCALLASQLARAFQNENAFSFIIPNAKDRAQRLPEAFRIFLNEDLRKGRIFMAPEQEAATLLRRPENLYDSVWDKLRLALPYLSTFGKNTARASLVASLIAKHLPKEPCWYLHYAGCAPEHQGKGFGSATIRAGLAAADADQCKTYLETADPKNLPIYSALGFKIIHSWKVPGGPEIWGMIRLPLE